MYQKYKYDLMGDFVVLIFCLPKGRPFDKIIVNIGIQRAKVFLYWLDYN